MARIRTIKPDFFFDEGIASLPHPVRLLFIGLWCLADKEGRLEDRPRFIGAQLFPYEKPDIDAMLDKLCPEWMVRYEVDGKKYIQINTFTKHQRIGNREPESVLPPCEAGLSTLKQGQEEGKGREGERKGRGSAEKERRVLSLLNEITGRTFKSTDANIKKATARLSEGYTIEDFESVFRSKQAEWGGDPKMAEYLRPETLLGTKFDSYLQSARYEPEPKKLELAF